MNHEIKTEEQATKEWEEFLTDMKWSERKHLFWEVIHNIRATLEFIVCLPVLPIVLVIQAIRGEL